MAKSLHISIADQVHEEIDNRMQQACKTNRSEFVEELLRTGLKNTPVIMKSFPGIQMVKKNEVDDDGTKEGERNSPSKQGIQTNQK